MAPVTPETAAAVRTAAEALRSEGFEVVEWRPENLDRAWKLWWNLFGRAGQMAFSPMLEGHEAELSSILQRVSSVGYGRDAVNRDRIAEHAARARCVAQQVPREDGGVSDFDLPGLFDSRVSSRRASLDGSGAQSRVLEGDGLFAVVQSARESRSRGSGGQITRRVTDWSADRRPTVGRRSRACGRGEN